MATTTTSVWVRVAVLAMVLSAVAVRSEVATATGSPPSATTTVNASSTDQGVLDNRFANEDGIHFASDSEDLLPHQVLESQVHRDVSCGIARLALNLDRALTLSPESAGSSPGGSTERAMASSTRDNVLFSPLSVAAVLSLLLLGSGGRTFDEVAQVLGLASEGGEAISAERDAAIHQHFGRLLQRLERRAAATDSSEALAAHGVFLQSGLSLRPRFRQVAQQAYSAETMALDFENAPRAAQAAVNTWVSEKTRGRITNIMADPPSPGTRLALASALYFNGQWANPFPRETTHSRSFYVDGDSSGEVINIDMMANNADLIYGNNSELHCQVLGLPYKGGDVVMYVALPHERGMAALRALESRLTLESLERMVSGARLERDVIVVLPRMKLDFSASLRPALERLGVRTLFSADANLTQLLEPSQPSQQRRHRRFASTPPLNEPLYVDDVLHKVEMEVTETGTVASAATLATVTRGPHFIVRADRPFLFFIQHQPTGLTLFWGTVVRPRPAAAVG